jgi:hypothetical protein
MNGRQQHRPILTNTLDPYTSAKTAKVREKAVFRRDGGHRRPIDDDHRTGGDASALPQATRIQSEMAFLSGLSKNDPWMSNASTQRLFGIRVGRLLLPRIPASG